MSDRFARIQLAQLRMTKLDVEAKRCTDPERLKAIGDEMEVIYESVMAIREEQLIEQLDPPTNPTRRPWWKFWVSQ